MSETDTTQEAHTKYPNMWQAFAIGWLMCNRENTHYGRFNEEDHIECRKAFDVLTDLILLVEDDDPRAAAIQKKISPAQEEKPQPNG